MSLADERDVALAPIALPGHGRVVGDLEGRVEHPVVSDDPAEEVVFVPDVRRGLLLWSEPLQHAGHVQAVEADVSSRVYEAHDLAVSRGLVEVGPAAHLPQTPPCRGHEGEHSARVLVALREGLRLVAGCEYCQESDDGRKPHACTVVPAVPASASSTRSAEGITAGRRQASAQSAAASSFGPMLPAGNCPRRRRVRASSTLSLRAGRSPGFRKSRRTSGTSVKMRSTSAARWRARSDEARSLSTTASTPRRRPPGSLTTGMPPPPAATTTTPAASRTRIASASTISSGSGDGTTRRKPRPAS